MGYQIFEMTDGQRIALYAQGNSVLSCRLPFGRGMFPAEIRRDYLAHFEAAVFQDTVCFVYEDLDHRIVMDTLGPGPARILLTEGEAGFDFCDLRLQVRDGELYLFYQAKTGYGETYGLYVCMPYLENRRSRICACGERPAQMEVMRTAAGDRLICADPQSGRIRMFDWLRETGFEEYRQVEEKEHEKRLSGLQAAWEKEREAFLEQQEEIQAEAMARLGEQQQEKEQRLNQCRREYEGRVERLREEYEEKLASCRREGEERLAQAKKQYDELAEMAVKLQRIGRRWRDKYFGRENTEGE